MEKTRQVWNPAANRDLPPGLTVIVLLSPGIEMEGSHEREASYLP